jgi:hypothetical protein
VAEQRCGLSGRVPESLHCVCNIKIQCQEKEQVRERERERERDEVSVLTMRSKTSAVPNSAAPNTRINTYVHM